MSAKDMTTNPTNAACSVKTDEFEADEFMVKHYNDPKLNCYEQGPGTNLHKQLPNKEKAPNCALYIASVPADLEERGIRNLCSKYGQVKEVQKRRRRHDNIFDAIVKFASVADAENAIYNINKMEFKVKGRTMKADFDNPKQRPAKEPQHKMDPVKGNIPNEFHLPLATPSPLIKPNQIGDQRMKILSQSYRKSPTILNGCASYSHSTDSISHFEEISSKAEGHFDELTQHFVHNATFDFTVEEQCKNCDNPTMKYCKGCKNALCSMHCLKEYNNSNGGCYCVSSKTSQNTVTKRNHYSVGRGAKLILAASRQSCYVPSSDSDTKSTESGTSKKEVSFTEAYPKRQNTDSVIQVEPCDLPKDNKLVVITNVVSNKIVFLRSFEPNDNERYVKYLNDLAEYAKTAPSLDEEPKRGDIVLAKQDGCYYRALVARIDMNTALVALLEIGSVLHTPTDNLKKLRQDLQNVQRFVFKALLSETDRQDIKSDNCLIYLYELLEKGVPLKFISKKIGSPEGQVLCELIVSETNDNVNEKLLKLNNIKPGQPVMDIPIEAFDAHATEVTVIDNSLAKIGIITVTIPEHLSDMFSMHQRIQEYCKEDYESPYTPRVNEICLAKSNDQWYRAKLYTSFGDKNPVMFFIDFALLSKVHVNNMRRMPLEFKFPLLSVMAEIGGVTDTTDLSKLADVFPPMSTVSVTKVEFVNGKTDEPTIYFNIPDGFPVKKGAETHSDSKPRQRLLENLRRKVSKVADDVFPPMSTVSAPKVEVVNEKTDEPTTHFNIPGVPEIKGPVAHDDSKPKQRLLENLKRKVIAKAEGRKI